MTTPWMEKRNWLRRLRPHVSPGEYVVASALVDLSSDDRFEVQVTIPKLAREVRTGVRNLQYRLRRLEDGRHLSRSIAGGNGKWEASTIRLSVRSYIGSEAPPTDGLTVRNPQPLALFPDFYECSVCGEQLPSLGDYQRHQVELHGARWTAGGITRPVQSLAPVHESRPVQSLAPVHESRPVQSLAPVHESRPVQSLAPVHEEPGSPQTGGGLPAAASFWAAIGRSLARANPHAQMTDYSPDKEPAVSQSVSGAHAPASDDGASAAAQVWSLALDRLQLQSPKPTFDTWLAGTSAVELQGGELTVAVPSSFAADWVEQHLQTLVESAASAAAGRPLKVGYVIGDARQAYAYEPAPPPRPEWERLVIEANGGVEPAPPPEWFDASSPEEVIAVAKELQMKGGLLPGADVWTTLQKFIEAKRERSRAQRSRQKGVA